MPGARVSEEQIIQILDDVETGKLTVKAVCHMYLITEDTFNRWLYTYRNMNTPTQRVRQLEQENMQLKRQVADLEREVLEVKEALSRFM